MLGGATFVAPKDTPRTQDYLADPDDGLSSGEYELASLVDDEAIPLECDDVVDISAPTPVTPIDPFMLQATADTQPTLDRESFLAMKRDMALSSQAERSTVARDES